MLRGFENWTRDKCVEPGFYATLRCWDPHEGFLPGANYWNGSGWDTLDPIVSWSERPFETWTEAEQWAYDRDPEQEV
jgi:hypothetical protein